MLTAKYTPRQSALFILRYQPRSLFPAPPPTSYCLLLRFSHEPTTSQSNARQKNGLARTRTIHRPHVRHIEAAAEHPAVALRHPFRGDVSPLHPVRSTEC